GRRSQWAQRPVRGRGGGKSVRGGEGVRNPFLAGGKGVRTPLPSAASRGNRERSAFQQDHQLLLRAAAESGDVGRGHRADDPALPGVVVEGFLEPRQVELVVEELVLGGEHLVLLHRGRDGVRLGGRGGEGGGRFVVGAVGLLVGLGVDD